MVGIDIGYDVLGDFLYDFLEWCFRWSELDDFLEYGLMEFIGDCN